MPDDRQATLDGLLSMVLEEHSLQSVVWGLQRIANRQAETARLGNDRFHWEMSERVLNDTYWKLHGQHCGEVRVRARSGG